MMQIYITKLDINKVRHLEDISIPLAEDRMKHLILTGKNGSGKTGLVEAMTDYINNVFKNLNQSGSGLNIRFNKKAEDVFTLRKQNHYILAYYSADRVFQSEQPRHVEKIQLRDDYEVMEFPRNDFVKYLLDLKMTEALARINQKIEKADEIKVWFERLENLLKKIFADETVQLEFDEDTFKFYILQKGKERFDFHTLSSGYKAVLDIVLDIMMRMQNQTGRSFDLC